MNRYLSSFVLSFGIYTSVVATIFYFMNNNSCEANSKIESTKVVKISLLNFQKEGEKQEEQKKVLEILKPKQESKKEVITKVEPKKIIKNVPKVALKEEIKQTIQEEQEVKQTQTQELAKEVQLVEQIVSKTQHNKENMLHQQLAQTEIQEREKSFFLKLRELINQNKSYPNSARRRGIEGNVEVRFYILENGNVENIELISGQSIFQNSVQEAIKKSFPMEVDKTLFSFPKEFKITLAYVLIQ